MTSFTEPSSRPGTGTMHTLDDIMAIAPAANNTTGATATDVLNGTTFWGLTSGQWGVETGTRALAPVPRTGQTTPHAVDDDAHWQKGVAWPNPRFTNNGDGTATDNLTRLIWLRDANCASFYADDVTEHNWRAWLPALMAAKLLATGHCGLSDGFSVGDWRLPNLRELQSLIHNGVAAPPVPNTDGSERWHEGDPFTDIQPVRYWSSTPVAGTTTVAWYVGMDWGITDFDDMTEPSFVWPVRGGQ
jgi:hypothetical protein